MSGGEGEDEFRFVLQELNDPDHTGVVFLQLAAECDQTEGNVMLIGPDDMS